jgi:hypothetical protein
MVVAETTEHNTSGVGVGVDVDFDDFVARTSTFGASSRPTSTT